MSFIVILTYYNIMLNIAEINLLALKRNAINVKSRLNKGVKFCAVVKADAYGHGASVVADYIYSVVDCYAVALVEEAVELRNSGIDKDILVLTPIVETDVERAVFYNLTITVESAAQILQLDKECKKQDKKIKVHLKYNVGMNRFGVDSLEELKELLELVKGKNRVILDGMYSHLPCPQNKKLLKIAQNKFLLANNLVKGYNNKAVCHLSASGGLLTGVQFDMVRVGILLYGYKPFETDCIKVYPVMKVYAPVVRHRKLSLGENALYGNYKLKKEQSACIIRFGYADGLERKNIKGQINNRCMDATMIEGSILSKDIVVMDNAQTLAQKYKTIPYEILTKISIRAQKKYIR